MKKVVIVTVLYIMTLAQSYSQKTLSTDYSYKISEPYRVFDAKDKFYLAKGNEVMALKFDGGDVMLQKFDSDKPTFIKEKKYEKFFPKNYSVEKIVELSDKYYFFFSSWEGNNDKEQLFSIEINFATGEFVESPKLLFQVDGKVMGAAVPFGIKDKFDFFESYDKKNILIQYRKRPKVRRDDESFDIIGLFTYDANLNKTFGNELTMPYTESRMDNLDYQLDNKGNLYILSKIFNTDKNSGFAFIKRIDAEPNYHIELFTIKAGSDKIDISKIENDDKFINKLWLFDTDKDFLVCGGLYSNGKGNFNDCDGIMLFKIKADGTIYDKVFHEIPLEVLNQYESERTQKRNEKKEKKDDNAQFSNLKLKDLFINKDGSIVLIGEQYFTVTTTNYNPQGGNTSTTSYYYCDILASKINADGTLAWMKKIPKYQRGSRGKGGMSYKYINANNNHYLVFLDNVKNIDLPLDKEPKQHTDRSGGYLTAVKVSDTDGALTKGSILNSRDVEDINISQFSTNRIIKTSENSFLLEVYKKQKEDIMIKVSLN
jgi:hypothetical protein